MATNIQHEEINLSLNNDKKAFEDLSGFFNLLAQALEKVDQANKELIECLKKIQKQLSSEIPKLAEVVSLVAESMSVGQKKNLEYVDLIKSKIILSLNGQLEQIKTKQKLLDDYKAKTAIEADRDQKRKNTEPAKQKETYQAYEQAKKEKMLAGQTLNTQYQIYINEKNQEFCSMWKHFLNMQMYCCAAGLQSFSKSAQEIHNREQEVKKDAEIFLSKLLGNQRNQLNFSYLKRLFPNLEQILYTGKFTSLNEFDKCTQLWHQAGFQGPFFLIKLTDQCVFIILNQNSTQDFIRTIKKGLTFELNKGTQWFYFNFQDEQQKVFNIWFQEQQDFENFKVCLERMVK
ncbi:unnamed protein product [Paramecium octaurelia]|uniref:Uncharacterized protein n=1 Tax=Paramecium octaurelia TaxID=43137 RepID=A0A8S1VIE9_PAROT|nr:unnamed protein product [Paramecium octaurelia]